MPDIIKPIRINNFEGGLSLLDNTLIKDNQLSVATNVFYNNAKKLQTRYGQISFGNAIPATVVMVHNCDTYNGNGTWTASDDAASVSTEASAMKRGAGAVKFNVSVAGSANDYATVTNTGLSAVDISAAKGHLGFWFYTPAAGTTDLTNLQVRIGSDASNQYEWTVLPASLTAGSWVFLKLDFSSATVTGTPVDTAIDYAYIRLNYAVGYTDKTGFMIDDMACYSHVYNKPMMSLKYFEESVTPFTRHLITNVGTNVFEYDETSSEWTVIKMGVTEGKRYSATMYKNIMYFTNGTDNYASWNGKTWTEHTGANTYKGTSVLLANDIGYILGDPSVPSTLGYTAATPTNLQTFANALVLDQDSSDGIGTSLINLGPVVIASKERKIYKVNVATPSREQLDYSDGNLAERGFCNVENEVFLLNEAGVYTLAQREATTGSLRAGALSDDLQPLIDSIDNKTIANAFYNNQNNNFYLFFAEGTSTINNTCIVFSILTKKWTKFVGLNVNEMVRYKDSSGDWHLLTASSLTGQCKEIETTFADNGNAIYCEVQTKSFDFEQPETLKTFEIVEVTGFINELGELNVQSIVDDTDETLVATILGTTYSTGSTGALGSFLLGSSALGGTGGAGDVTMYPFTARIPMYSTGSRIRIKLYSQKANSTWILSKIAIYPFPQPLEIYNENNIY